MTMKKSTLSPMMLLLAVFLTGCTTETPEPSQPPVQETQDETQTMLSYEQYRQLYVHLAYDIKLTGLKKVADYSKSPEIVIVDEKTSFGKRMTLTLKGDNTARDATQNRIIYRNDEQGYLLYVDLLYLPNSLGRDLISWDNTPHPDLENVPNVKQFHQNMLAFHNTLVKLTLLSTGEHPVGPQQLNPITLEIVNHLEEYQF